MDQNYNTLKIEFSEYLVNLSLKYPSLDIKALDEFKTLSYTDFCVKYGMLKLFIPQGSNYKLFDSFLTFLNMRNMTTNFTNTEKQEINEFLGAFMDMID